MNSKLKQSLRLERKVKIMIWMAKRSSRNKSLLDKLCRFVLNRATTVKPDKDFMRDPLIDNDTGFDPDELDRYQRGEKI